MDDFFRSAANGLTSHPGNRRFLRALFDASFRRLGVAMRDVSADSDGGCVSVGAVVDRLGLERSTSGWAAASVANLDGVLVGDLSLHLGSRTLVIGWGLPPSLLNHIANAGAAFIDIEIDPLRFAPHLHLCARTNDTQIVNVLRSLEVPREVFWSSASTVQAYFARRGSSDLIGPECRVGLFAGQTEVDLALVSDGRLASLLDHLDQIALWAAEVDVLLVKPHPYAGEFSGVRELVERLPNAVMVEHNIYGMFTARNLCFVGALSSGALRECEFFGVASRALISVDRSNLDRLPPGCSPWITVSADVGSIGAIESVLRKARFWRGLRRIRLEPTFDPGALDGIFGVRWGLDTNAPGLPTVHMLAGEGAYRFGQSDDSVGWLTDGWHDAEHWGAWSAESLCRLVLPLSGAVARVGGNLRFELRGKVFGGARVCGIDLCGELLSPTCQVVGDSTVISVEVDAKRFEGRPAVIMGIHIEGAARPIDVTGQPDLRLLGFGLVELRVSAVQGAEPSRQVAES